MSCANSGRRIFPGKRRIYPVKRRIYPIADFAGSIMLPLLSQVYSSQSLMAGAEVLRGREERGLGSCGGLNAADESLLAELRHLQDWLCCKGLKAR